MRIALVSPRGCRGTLSAAIRYSLFAILLVGCGSPSRPASSSGGDFDAALDAFAKGDLAGADAKLRDRREPDAIRLRARILMMQNRNREAIELLLPLAPQRGQKVKTYEAMESQNAVLPDLALAYVRQDDFRNAGAVYGMIGEAILARKYDSLSRVVAYSSNVGAEEITVPFEFTDPVPVVSGTVNGMKALFAIDTLTDQLTLSRAFAKRVRAEGETVQEVGIGRATVKNVPIHLDDPFDTGRQAVDGVIGLQFLMHFDFTLDYRRGRLVLRKAGGPLPAGRPAFIAGDRYLLTGGLVNGKDPVFVGVGTSLRGVTLAASEMAVQGIPVASFEAGPIKLSKPALEFKAFPQGLDGAFGMPVGFVLGHSALKGRILRLEPASMKLLIE